MSLFSLTFDSRKLSSLFHQFIVINASNRYELLKWEEYQRLQRGLPLRREMEWATVAREIALMNKPYSSR